MATKPAHKAEAAEAAPAAPVSPEVLRARETGTVTTGAIPDPTAYYATGVVADPIVEVPTDPRERARQQGTVQGGW